MKILIAGANGMLGTEIKQLLSNQNYEIDCVDVDTLDLMDYEKSLAYIKAFAPDCIINCAAYTNVDGCETEVELAYQLNALLPRNLAVIAQKIGAKLVHVSTDYVFDGNSTIPHKEDHPTNPLSIYGKSKLAGEQNVQTFCNQFFIIRTQWLYGVYGKNFVKTMLLLSEKQDTLKVVDDQYGSPTYTKDLAVAIIGLIQTEYYGVYHLTNSGVISWHQFTKDICELCKRQTVVNPCTTEEFPRPAMRPKYSALDNFNYRIQGFMPLRHYKEALEEYLTVDEKIKK